MERGEIKRRLVLPLVLVTGGLGGAALAGFDTDDIARGATSVVRSIDGLAPEDSFCVNENSVSGDPVGEPSPCDKIQDSSYITE